MLGSDILNPGPLLSGVDLQPGHGVGWKLPSGECIWTPQYPNGSVYTDKQPLQMDYDASKDEKTTSKPKYPPPPTSKAP